MDWTTMSVIELVRDIWMNNACVKFDKSYRANNEIVTRRRRRGGCVADENIISPKTYVSREYNDLCTTFSLYNFLKLA